MLKAGGERRVGKGVQHGMEPKNHRPIGRRQWLARCCCLGIAALGCGCSQPAMRSQSPEEFEQMLADVHLVGDVSIPFGMHPLVVESVGLVTNLANTGRDLPPSNTRAMLIGEMQRRGVEHPNQVLESTSTSAVVVRASLKPGLEKGDRFDVEVTLPQGCETTSLRGGNLLEARMREMAVVSQQVHQGHVFGLAKGPLMIDPLADEKNPREKLGARIIEGGVALQPRPLGLMIKPDERSVRTASEMGTAINQRFHLRRHGIQTGVAVPKTDRYIELTIHPRYKDNVPRYFQVIRGVALAESASQRQMRLQLLERQLLDSVTSATAAVRLEAIGKDGIGILKKGVASSDPEVRFYAAEALAYLDDSSASPILAAAARDDSALRARALAALSAMDDPTAYEQLVGLMDSASAETRYGAFRALWAMNPRDAAVRGEMVAGQFSVHLVRSKGPAMVHVTRAYRPEIVFFGSEHSLRTPIILNVGSGIVVRDLDSGRLSVSRFAPGEPDQKREIAPSTLELVQALAAVGGTYPDVVQALLQAKNSGSLASRLEVDAVPKTDRVYQPSEVGAEDGAEESAPKPTRGQEVASQGYQVDGPAPDLYPAQDKPLSRAQKPASGTVESPEEAPSAPTEAEDPTWPLTRRAGKMMGRLIPPAP